ncbi:hypothetical protein [Pelosinus propionicus]|uniref:hypothetical protein n=1 Tax=Pelosinus propionicus TaxID=380084 RepID=UPI00111377DF|nr:hypothetical protein [Pelosinus propionicus]
MMQWIHDKKKKYDFDELGTCRNGSPINIMRYNRAPAETLPRPCVKQELIFNEEKRLSQNAF